jgi:hypothetical protein
MRRRSMWCNSLAVRSKIKDRRRPRPALFMNTQRTRDLTSYPSFMNIGLDC